MKVTLVANGHAQGCAYQVYPMPIDHGISVVYNNEPHVKCIDCSSIITLPGEDEPHPVLEPYRKAQEKHQGNRVDEQIVKICQLWVNDSREVPETIDALEHDIWEALCNNL